MIEVKNLYKTFDGKNMILENVSYHVKKGEKLVIIGPSGGGKSTFLRCLNLLEKPTYGEIWVNDRLITPVDPDLTVGGLFKQINATQEGRLASAGGTDNDQLLASLDVVRNVFQYHVLTVKGLIKILNLDHS